MTGSRLFRWGLVLLAAGYIVAAMDERESVSSTTSRRNLGSRIVGGTKANPTRYPYFTYLDIVFDSGNYYRFCGGTLIAKDVVLTAAHCLDPSDWNETLAFVDAYVNSTSMSFTSYEYYRPASFYLIHPSYDWETALRAK